MTVLRVLLEEREASSKAERVKVLILGITGFTCEEFLRKECK